MKDELLIDQGESAQPLKRDHAQPAVALRYAQLARVEANVPGQVARQPARAGRLVGVRHVVAVASGRAGVGKSTLAANLALACAQRGLRTGLLDADINGGTVARQLGITRAAALSPEGLVPAVAADGVRVISMDLFVPEEAGGANGEQLPEALSWHSQREENAVSGFLADTLWGELDLLLVDLPPESARRAAAPELLPVLSGALLVCRPMDLGQRALRRVVAALREAQVPALGLVVNFAGTSCPDCGAYTPLFTPPPAGADALLGLALLGTVPLDPGIARAAQDGEVYLSAYWEAAAARALREIAAALVERLSWP